ncbi:MAG TPA: enoyl-CoA hydratase/isomerase family protein [Acidimicrobiia bacterium]|nr:enoyl-CoA hydratase/isomerase family protein [Acidimicrobiia bacterium]
MQTEWPGVRLEDDGAGVAELTLCRPEVLNRVDAEVHESLTEAFRAVAGLDGVRALVFASTGKAFSAGGDFDFILRQNADPVGRQSLARDALALLSALLDIPVPVVVALHGDAMGLGATLVLGADAVVAARRARLADPHVAIGLVAGDGGCLVWPQSAGMLTAKRYLLTGDALDAETALRAGLVTDLVDSPEDALPAARALAQRIAGLPPLAVQGTKAALNNLQRARFAEVMALSATLEQASIASDDIREAVAAFREKRPPAYRGR